MKIESDMSQLAIVFLKLPFIFRFKSRVYGGVSLLRVLIFTGDTNTCKHVGRTCLKVHPTEKKAEQTPKLLRTWLEGLDWA